MPLYQAIILAIIQGLTEFLPVSSTAHLAVLPALLHWKDPGLAFDVALHAGTLAAVIVYFFKDWMQIIANGFGMSYGGSKPDENNRMLLWFLLVGTIPVGIAGKLLKHWAEGPWRTLYVIGAMLIIVGILMALGDRLAQNKRRLDSMTWTDALTVGVAQALAVIPGTSRSGITITAGRFRQLDREAAARFSFLLSTPAIAAAAGADYLDLRKHGGVPADMKMAYLVGIVVSGLVGIVVIAFFLQYLRRNTLTPFVWYRIVLGVILIVLAAWFGIGAV